MRARIIAANDAFSKRASEIARPLIARGRRTPIPRQGMLIDAAREWARLPSFGLLDSALELGRLELRAQELRVCASDYRAEDWGPGAFEPGISIVGVVLDVRPRVFGFDVVSLCCISQHTLGRWFQRALDTSDEGLMDDLRCLAKAHAGLASGDATDFGVSTASGAHWRGSMIEVEDPRAPGAVDLICSVRTFLE
jgi:hypothetical protein